MRCIDADKLIMKDLGNGNYLVTAEAMADARTFEADPIRHGHWEFPIFDDGVDGLDPRGICSVCGSIETPLVRHKYCPSCGAKMDEVKR